MAFYASGAADSAIARMGLQATHRDWREAFLAITGAVLGEATGAQFAGMSWREREAWNWRLGGVPVVLIYDPARATIVTVLPTKRGKS